LDREALKKIVEADHKNILTLIKISPEVETKIPKDAPFWDQITYKDVLNEVLEPDKYQYWAFIYHFQFFYDLQIKALKYILLNYAADYSAWFPFYLTAFNEILLFHRHLIRHHFKEIINLEKDSRLEYLQYLASIYKDRSALEIIEIEEYAFNEDELKWIHNQNNSNRYINIKNSDIDISVSSELSTKYQKEKMLDYDLSTVWAEGVEGDGVGEWIEIKLKKEMNVDQLILFPGHSKSQKLFFANNRIKELEIIVNEFSKIHKIRDVFAPISISIERETQNIKIHIKSVYKGSKYNDLCVSELMLTKMTKE
jgi:hypothetical protein